MTLVHHTFFALAVLLAACVETPTSDSADGTADSAQGDDRPQTDDGGDALLGEVEIGPDLAPDIESEVEPAGCEALVCDEEEQCSEEGGQAVCVLRCAPPTVWNALQQQCVPPPDCGSCETQARTCDTSSGAAVCGDCLTTHVEEDGECLTLGNCDAGAADSKRDDCASINRSCVGPAGGQAATCGACLDGFVETPGEALCSVAQACSDDGSCDANTTCMQLGADDDGALCTNAICAAGQAWDRTNDSCRSCSDCSGEGVTGVVWPVTAKTGQCVCETQPGYFWDPAVAATQAVACDKDGDGWTNEKVAQLLAQVSKASGAPFDDFALFLNVRCDVATIDGVVMVNEMGQHKALSLAELGSTADALPLFETSRNDRGDATDPMPAHGRPFLPQEANSLTKACAANIDLNDNGLSDPLEGQDYDGGAAFQQMFNRLGYFTELYSGALIDGKWHIIERTRCDPGFPLAYTDDADPYWRSCHRRRAIDYPSNGPELGFDFAQYECDASGGACALEPGAIETATGTSPPPHGVCDDLPVATSTWRGMTHYSQFSCVSIRNTQAALGAGEVALSDVRPEQTWVASNCALGAEADTLDCTPLTTDAEVEAAVDTIVWAARTFAPYETLADYDGGCLDEGTEWPQLCPGFGDDPQVVAGTDASGFGTLTCGCAEGFEYADAGCVDVDECADAGLNPCDTHASCSNTVGSATCSCNPGFEGDGFNCDDVDECALGLDDCYDGFVQAMCSNTMGGFTCTCPAGYPGDGVTCDDGLIAYFPMGGPLNAYPVIEDATGNGNDGEVLQDLPVVAVVNRFFTEGQAWQFQSSVPKTAMQGAPLGDGSYTMAVWFRPGDPAGVIMGSSNTGSGYILVGAVGCGIRLISAGGGNPCVAESVGLGWYLLVVSYEKPSDTISVTVTGTDMTATASSPGSPFVAHSNQTLYTNDTTYYDDARVFDRVLTPSEIDALYHEDGYDL